MGSCGGSQTTTQTTSPNPQAAGAYYNLLNTAQNVAAVPYAPYSGEGVAPINAQQYAGIAGINANANWAQPYMTTAAQIAAGAAQPVTQQMIQSYMSPYTQDVVNATQAQFADQNARQLAAVKGNAVAQGAIGGNREAIAEAETTNEQQLAQAPVIANLENQGYSTGLNTALTEQQEQLGAANTLGNVGVAGENAALTGANAQIGAGTLEEQVQQAIDAYNMQNLYTNPMQFPYAQTGWLAGIDTGVGSQLGGTSQTIGPPPNTAAQVAGLGIAGLGALGQAGGAGGIAALPFLARGGGVATDQHHITMPESHETLLAQQHQLMAGHRAVQMFPPGTRELHVPPGMRRIETRHGAFHYDPSRIHGDTIRHLSELGRENELLNLGPFSKHDVLHRTSGGEIPVAIVERDPNGTEVRSAAGTHVTAPHQLAAMHQTKTPGNTIGIEDPRAVLAQRSGGVVHRDAGGGVAYPTFGGGYGTPSTPYGASHLVPSLGITRGPGPPRPPQPPRPDGSLDQDIKDVSALGKQLGDRQKAAAAPTSLAPIGQPAYTPTPTGVVQPPSVPTGDVYYRGGGVAFPSNIMVQHRADGGPTSSDTTDSGMPILDGDLLGLNQRWSPTNPAIEADRAYTPDGVAPPLSHAVQTISYKRPDRLPAGNPTPPPPDVPPSDTDASGVVPPHAMPFAPDRRVSLDQVEDLPDEITKGHTPRRSGPVSLYDAGAPLPALNDGVAPSSGIDWSSNSKLWPAVMAAGFRMAAAGARPGASFFGSAGEGGMSGMQEYVGEQQRELQRQEQQFKQALSQKELNLAVAKLNESVAERDRPYNERTLAQQDEANFRQFEESKPIPISDPILGQRSAVMGKDGKLHYTDTGEVVGEPNQPIQPITKPQQSAGPQASATPQSQTDATVTNPDRPFQGTQASTASAIKAMEMGLHGQAFLDAVPLEMRNTLEAVANYQAPITDFTKMGRAGMSQDRALALVRQINPYYNQNWYALQGRALNNFYASTAPNSPVIQARAYNTAMGHAGDLADAFDKLHQQDPGGFEGMLQRARESGTPFLSYISAEAQRRMATGTPQGSPWATIAATVPLYAAETAKFYSGSAGSQEEKNTIQAPFNPNLSYTEQINALHAQAHMFKSKTDPLEEEFRQAMDAPGLREYGTAPQAKQWIATKEHAQQALDRIESVYQKVNKPAANPAQGQGQNAPKKERKLNQGKYWIRGPNGEPVLDPNQNP